VLRDTEIEAMKSNAGKAAGMMRLLSSEVRLMVLCQLGLGEKSVGELNEAVGLSQSALSQHLARLRAEGIVHTRREAQTIYYSIADERVTRIVTTLYDIFCKPAKGNRK
jgi:DNA-binding transcriptional ArsR family regulator